ncbi:MAG: type II toxin-antitoxin system VapC family toxin [Saprospiraceae bacterium]|nr:type II toxin-antitoxin system VapC family toxin [Saprospiraceae bacterium]
MAQIAVDSNVLLRFILRDDEQQALLASSLFRNRCSVDAPAFVTLITCTELDFVLRKFYEWDRGQVYDLFSHLLTFVELEFEGEFLLAAILDQYRNSGADLADLLISQIAKHHGCTTTFTFDKKAAKRPGFTLLK